MTAHRGNRGVTSGRPIRHLLPSAPGLPSQMLSMSPSRTLRQSSSPISPQYEAQEQNAQSGTVSAVLGLPGQSQESLCYAAQEGRSNSVPDKSSQALQELPPGSGLA